MAEPLPSIYVLDPPELSLEHRALVAAVLAWLGSPGEAGAAVRAGSHPAMLAIQTATCPLPAPSLLLVPLLDMPSTELLSSLRARWTHACFLGVVCGQGSREDGLEALTVLPELDGVLLWQGLSSIPRLFDPSSQGHRAAHLQPQGQVSQAEPSIAHSDSPRNIFPSLLRHSTDCLTRAGGWSQGTDRNPAPLPRAVALLLGQGGPLSAALFTEGGAVHEAAHGDGVGEVGILQVWPGRHGGPPPPWATLLTQGWRTDKSRALRLKLQLAPGLPVEALRGLSEALAQIRPFSQLTLRLDGIPAGETLELIRTAGVTHLELLHEADAAGRQSPRREQPGPLGHSDEGAPASGLSSAALPPRSLLMRLARLPARVELAIPVGRPADTLDGLLTLLNQIILIPGLLPKFIPLRLNMGVPLRGQAETGLRLRPSGDSRSGSGRAEEPTPLSSAPLLLPGLARSRSGSLVSTPGFTLGALQSLEQLEQLLAILREAGLASVRGVAQALRLKPTQVLEQLLSDGLLGSSRNPRARLQNSLAGKLRSGGCAELVPVLTQLLDLEFWLSAFRRRHPEDPRPDRVPPYPLPGQAVLARNPFNEVRSFGFDLIRVLSDGLQGVAHRRTHLLLRYQAGGAPPLLSILPERQREQLELLQHPRTVAEMREEARARGWELRDHNALLGGPESLLELGLAKFRGIRPEKARPFGENVLPFQPPGAPRQILPFRKARPKGEEDPEDPTPNS